MVHIEHEQRERQLMAQAAGDFLFGPLLEEPAVVQVGERIGDDLATDAVVFLGSGQRGLDVTDQRVEYDWAEVGEGVRLSCRRQQGEGHAAVELER